MKKLELPFHVVKRSAMPVWQSLLIRGGAVLAALLLCAILSIVMIDANPIKFIATMFKGAFGNIDLVWTFAKDAALLLCIALAVTPAFKMRFWNIGAEGQTLIGALAAVAVIIYAEKLPSWAHLPNWMILILMLVAAVLAGAVWGGLPALFKALWGTNETLFTLMMNYVAMGLVSFCIALWVWVSNGSGKIPLLPTGHLPEIGHENLLPILLVLLLTVAVFIYQKYTKHGYELSVVGESENTANYVGINVKKVIIRTMLISGAICGFTGFLIVSAFDHSVATDTAGGMGFTAIMVSWLAKFNPLIMIGTSSFITFLDRGAAQITTDFKGVDSSFPDIVMGIVLFFIIGCEFFINYQIKKKRSSIALPKAAPVQTSEQISEQPSVQDPVLTSEQAPAQTVDKYFFSPVAHILLSVFLTNIWSLVWVFRTTRFTNLAKEQTARNPVVALLLYYFVPFYHLVWIYRTAKRIDAIAIEHKIDSHFASPLLILFFFFPIVAVIMMQFKINAIAEKTKQNQTEGGSEQ